MNKTLVGGTSLLPHPDSPGVARNLIDSLEPVLDGAVETMKLMISEVVTNSIRHRVGAKDATIDIAIYSIAGGFRAEVSDYGQRFTRVMNQQVDGQTSGWGLILIESLASRWGVSVDDGTKVWFEVLDPPSLALP